VHGAGGHVTLGLIPTTQYATPSSEENARAIRDLICRHDAIILQRHGPLTVDRDLPDVFFKLQTVEQAARIAFCLKQLGGGSPLPPTQVEKLLELRQAIGLARPNDTTEFRQHGARCSEDQRRQAQHTLTDGGFVVEYAPRPPSSSGLGRGPFKAKTRVRIPVGA
jgi:hypothetical protein